MDPRCTIITKPKIAAVYQRNENNSADITVEVLYTRPVSSIKVKAVRSDYSSEWIALKLSYSTGSGIITLSGGGWYTLYLKAMDENDNVIEEDTLIRFGIGDVYITCGQSNSLNFGETVTKAESDLVVSYNPNSRTWQSCMDPQPSELGPEVDMGKGGSIWSSVGDILALQLQIPIGFYATGWGGAALEEFAPETVKYQRLLNALKTVGIGGARAVLWHQGETDAVFNPDTERYKSLLLDLIKRSREDGGWDIKWIVAQAAPSR